MNSLKVMIKLFDPSNGEFLPAEYAGMLMCPGDTVPGVDDAMVFQDGRTFRVLGRHWRFDLRELHLICTKWPLDLERMTMPAPALGPKAHG